MARELPKSNLGRALRLVRLNTKARDTIKILREQNKNDLADAIEEICGEWMEKQNAVDVVNAAHEFAQITKEAQS